MPIPRCARSTSCKDCAPPFRVFEASSLRLSGTQFTVCFQLPGERVELEPVSGVIDFNGCVKCGVFEASCWMQGNLGGVYLTGASFRRSCYPRINGWVEYTIVFYELESFGWALYGAGHVPRCEFSFQAGMHACVFGPHGNSHNIVKGYTPAYVPAS